MLLASREPTSRTEKRKRRLLHYAADFGSSGCINVLLKPSASGLLKNVASPQDEDKQTPLHLAISTYAKTMDSSRLDNVRLLLDRGAVIKIEGKDGWGPMHLAAYHDLSAVIKLIHGKAASIGGRDVWGFRDNENRTPLLVAAQFKKSAAVETLVAYGSDLNAEFSFNGKKHTAATIGSSESMKIVRDVLGKTKFDDQLKSGLKGWFSASPLRKEIHSSFAAGAESSSKYMIDSTWENKNQNEKLAESLEKLKTRKYDVLKNPFFESSALPHSSLHLSLAYAAASSKGLVSVYDVSSSLLEYEATLQNASDNKVDPLYLLAHARLASLEGEKYQSIALLGEFQKSFPIYGSWLTDKEKEQLNPLPYVPSVNNETNNDTTEPEVRLTGPFANVKEEWIAMKKVYKLSAEKTDAMDDLMDLTGLESVKKQAIAVFTSIFASKRLRDHHQKKSRNGEKLETSKVLNFTFLGNPGTGKTTVARIFAKILEAAGAREGHKFIQMTASQALRKGSSKFATELAGLTGGDSSVGPPPTELREGMQVEVLHSKKEKDMKGAEVTADKYYPGKVSAVNDDKTYDVAYTDGTTDKKLPKMEGGKDKIRAIGTTGTVGGVLFLDEAYDLDPANSSEGKAIMAEIMNAAEDHREKVTIILAGYKDDIENKLYAYNTGMPSRFIDIHFDDFTEEQLQEIWESCCKCGGYESDANASTVAARRLHRLAKRKGFGNARAVRKLAERTITEAEPRFLRSPPGSKPMIEVTDILGMPPDINAEGDLKNAFDELNSMTGQQRVKKEMFNILELARTNYESEKTASKIRPIALNRVMLGSPGTGKTTMASIYGKILRSLRLLSKGDVILKTTSDFVGSAVGESQNKTKAILEMAEGCVLVIDEAYGLDDQLYGKQVLDTIVEKVSGKPGEDIAVILIGYDKEMKKMLRDQNPGLARRFDLSYALRFEDFSDQELLEIFSDNINREEIICPFKVKKAAVKHLAKKRAMKNFGNAGAVNNLVADSIKKMQSRIKEEREQLQELKEGGGDPKKIESLQQLIAEGQSKDRPILSIADVLGESSSHDDNPLEILKTLEGDQNDGYLLKLKNIGVQVNVRKKQGRDLSGIVQNFIFTGNAGTGKTTVAKKMAKLLYAFGLLATDSVVETSGLGLTGQYIGQTKKAVEEKMEEARGGVLFIDEAYELGRGAYGEEAMTQLLAMLTMDEYKDGKTVVIMAGYKVEIDKMLNRNQGLKSRFDDYIHFEDWKPQKCLGGVVSALARGQIENNGLNDNGAPSFSIEALAEGIILDGFTVLKDLPGWANARDSGIMFKKLISAMEKRIGMLIPEGGDFDVDSIKDEITTEDATNAVAEFLLQRQPQSSEEEEEEDDPTKHVQQTLEQQDMKLPPAPPTMRQNTVTKTKKKEKKKSSGDSGEEGDNSDGDVDDDQSDKKGLPQSTFQAEVVQGVTDKCELCADEREKIIQADREALNILERQEEENRKRLKVIEEQRKARLEAERIAKEEEERLRKEAEEKRICEETLRLRLAQLEKERLEREEAARLEKLEKERLENEMRAREEELKKQRKREILKMVSNCPAGYSWRRCGGGWVCSAGGHSVSDETLEREYTRRYKS